MFQWSHQTNYERLILALGISALVCLMGIVGLRLLQVVPPMLLFLLMTGQLLTMGGLIGARALVVIVRFHVRRNKTKGAPSSEAPVSAYKDSMYATSRSDNSKNSDFNSR